MKSRIILSGGLGNQMFQYAFYLSMLAHGKVCCTDASLYYCSEMHNGYELKRVFGIPESTSPPSRLYRVWINGLLSKKPKWLLFRDRPYQFCREVYQTARPHLMGCWLSPLYFNNIQDKVRESFRFRGITTANMSLGQEMQSCNSVAVHIRRGDYLKLPIYHVCDETYYQRAIEMIRSRVENPVFYIFSNEPRWCEDFMKRFAVRYRIVDSNQGVQSYQDMYLMTCCRHIIIANSTFSWWGAWLNNAPDRIVVSPHKWLTDQDVDLNCPGWVLI